MQTYQMIELQYVLGVDHAYILRVCRITALTEYQ